MVRKLVISSGSSRQRAHKAPAAELYTGKQNKHLMKGLEQVRRVHGERAIDLAIISEKYGLLGECDVIEPYDCAFQGLKTEDILAQSDRLQIHERTKALIMSFDTVFFLLGKEYVQALRLPFEDSEAITQMFLLGPTHKELIPDLPNLYFIPAGVELARRLGVTNFALKGVMFKRLCEVACREGFGVFETVNRIRNTILSF